MVILDTCAIIEIVKPKPSFSRNVISLIDQGATVLSVSFAEIACKIKLGKLQMSVSTHDLFLQFNQIEHLEVVDIGVNEWLNAINLLWDENKDPADRLITAFAIQHELSIVTTDKKIGTFYKKIIW